MVNDFLVGKVVVWFIVSVDFFVLIFKVGCKSRVFFVLILVGMFFEFLVFVVGFSCSCLFVNDYEDVLEDSEGLIYVIRCGGMICFWFWEL